MAGVQLLPGILPAAARVIVEIPFGANLNIDASNWPITPGYTDVTADLWQSGPVTITPMGRGERFAQAQPAGCSFRLDNSTGKYSKGPASSLYPFVRANTPVRISVTLNGISLFTRFFGYIEAWEPHDDPSAKVAWVNVTAWGKMHTLDLKNQPVTNLLARYHVRNGAAAVWPFDDGNLSTQAANAVPNGPPMKPGVGAIFGVDVSDPVTGLPAVGTAASLQIPPPNGDVFAATLNAPLSGLLHLDMWRRQAAEPDASEQQMLVVDLQGGSASLANIEIRARTSQISPLVKAAYTVLAGGVQVMDSANGSPGSTIDPADGRFHNVHVTLQQISGNVQATLFVDGNNVDSHTFTTTTLPTLLSTVHLRNAIVAGPGTGNFDRQSVIAINTTSAGAPSWTVGNGRYNGEGPTDRLTRLCAEEGLGVPLLLTGTSNYSMGIQKADTLPNLLRECESADMGVLYDGVSQGLAYIARSAKYNQAATLTLDAAAAQLDPPFEPKDQDPQRRNLWVVGRRDGSSVTARDKTGPLGTDNVGTLSQSVNGLNLTSDVELPNIAGWLLRLGTVNEPYQYPRLNLDLSAIPSLAANWLATTIGERIDITNLSTVAGRHPPGTVSLILEGYTEIIGPYEWTVQANCSHAPPWQVTALNQTFELEMTAQTLAANLVPGATSLSLATAAGHQLFTTTARFPADFPQDIVVAGWPIHVTAASGVSSPQTLTIDPAPNTSTIPSTTPVFLLRPAALAL